MADKTGKKELMEEIMGELEKEQVSGIVTLSPKGKWSVCQDMDVLKR